MHTDINLDEVTLKDMALMMSRVIERLDSMDLSLNYLRKTTQRIEEKLDKSNIKIEILEKKNKKVSEILGEEQ